jgi:CMP-N,N'-diacetyllegionaminic acid synthase
VVDKNVKVLAGHPLIAYSIAAAQQSGIFGAVIVSTDSLRYADLVKHYGGKSPYLRPSQMSGDVSPDIEWVSFTLERLRSEGRHFDCFSILRPTSPFRQAQTITRAWKQFLGEDGVDSLRAVEKCKQHPGKMWVVRGNRMVPLLPLTPDRQPWHSSQYQSLPEVYVQNASLEIAWSRVVFEKGTIAGDIQMPFFTEGYEGFDLNYDEDWDRAEEIVRKGLANLPLVASPQYSFKE